MTAPDPDTAALAGLRRLVLHARDRLVATKAQAAWKYNSDAWSPSQVERYAACLLAIETLTLVADCIETEGRGSDD